MNVSDRPEGPADEALSFNDGVESISNLLSPGTPDPEKAEVDEPDTEEEDVTAEADEPDADADPEAELSEGDEDPDTVDEDAGPSPYADENLKVRMADGREITVAELRTHADERVKEIQRDSTRKWQEAAERTKRVEQAEQTIAQNRDFLLAVYERVMPQAPDPSMIDSDPIGYMQAKENYALEVERFNQLRAMQAQEAQERQAQTQEQVKAQIERERDALFNAVPELKAPGKLEAFQSTLVDNAKLYGVTPEEVNSIADHRQLIILRDAIAYRKLKADAAQKAKAATEGKPKVLVGGKRMDPNTKISREKQVRSERLRKTGDLDAGIAALMDLDL